MSLTALEMENLEKLVEARVAERFGHRIEVLEAREKAVSDAKAFLVPILIDKGFPQLAKLINARYPQY